jgi:hypothetical protein
MNETVAALNSLSIFGPGQGGAYREHSAAVRAALGPDVPTKLGAYINNWARSETPGVLVLTGNAGTGKTALAEAFCAAVGAVLPVADELVEVSGRRFVVKDLSGVLRSARADVLRLADEIAEQRRDAQLLVCANEGLLREALEDQGGGALSSMLDLALERGAASSSERGSRILVVNMNRQRWTGQEEWTALLDYLTRAELWGECDGCPVKAVCPIRRNADALRDPTVREGGRRLVQLGSGSSVASLRELLALLARSITGGLRCEDVVRRTAPGGQPFSAHDAYFNLFLGAELSEEQVERSSLLQAIRETGVGHVADLEVDGWLRDSGPAPIEIRRLANPADATPHGIVFTRIGAMTFHDLGETVTISDDAIRVESCLKDLASGANFLSLWRRLLFFEAHPFIGGRAGAFARLSRFSFFGELLNLAEQLRAGRETAEERQRVIIGLNYLSAGFHAFNGHLVVPDAGSLAARNPGSFRPPFPSLVHSEVSVDHVALRLEDGDELRHLVDTDDVRVVLRVERGGGRVAELVLTPRLYQAIRESSDFRAPVGGDIPEMTELSAFYAELAEGPAATGLHIVDPGRGTIKKVTLPAVAGERSGRAHDR